MKCGPFLPFLTRLEDRSWVLPDIAGKYGRYPAVRYVPSYEKTTPVAIGGTAARFTIVNPLSPAKANPHAARPDDPLAANAVGSPIARVRNISISRVKIENVSFTSLAPDDRPAVVLDDVDVARFEGFTATTSAGAPAFVKVTNTRKRAAGFEYVKDQPYRKTTVTNVVLTPRLQVKDVTVDRPAPGTPPDSLYAHPTAPSETHPYSYPIDDADYPKPRTVYPHMGVTNKAARPRGIK
jgi:hypothetical protein